jgi:hypothetical protein
MIGFKTMLTYLMEAAESKLSGIIEEKKIAHRRKISEQPSGVRGACYFFHFHAPHQPW